MSLPSYMPPKAEVAISTGLVSKVTAFILTGYRSQGPFLGLKGLKKTNKKTLALNVKRLYKFFAARCQKAKLLFL